MRSRRTLPQMGEVLEFDSTTRARPSRIMQGLIDRIAELNAGGENWEVR